MKIKKTISVILLACMIFALCACGQQAPAAATPAPAATQAPAETPAPTETPAEPTPAAAPATAFHSDLATLAGAAVAKNGDKFNTDVFKNNNNYTIADAGTETAIYANAQFIPVINDNNGTATFDVRTSGSDSSPYVMRLECTYAGQLLIGAQKLIIMTDGHRYDFTPTISQDNGKEYIYVNLASKETLELVKELGTTKNTSFSILGATKTINGEMSVKNGERLVAFYNDYIKAGGLTQDLVEASKANACDILEVVNLVAAPQGSNAGRLFASPSSGLFYNTYNSVYLYSNNGDRIHYDVYSGSYLIGSGEVKSGECVWIPGTNGVRTDVYLTAYVVGDPNNAINCSYTIDCTYYYYSSGNNNTVVTYSNYQNAKPSGNSGLQQYVDNPLNGYDPTAAYYNKINGTSSGGNTQLQEFIDNDPYDMNGYDIEADFNNWVMGRPSENGDKFDKMFEDYLRNPDSDFDNLTDEEFYNFLETNLPMY